MGGLQSGGDRLWGFNFPEVHGQRGVRRGGEYGGIGAGKKEEVSVSPLLSASAETPLS